MTRRTQGNVRSFAGSSLIPFLDLAMLLGVLTLFLSTIQLPHLNDPTKGEDQRRSDVKPTAIFAQVGWTLHAPHDVDVYMKCTIYVAGAVTANVNYRQKNSGFLDLVVDDLGRPSVENYERVLSNSILDQVLPNMQCQLNAHLYSSRGGELPIRGVFHVILNKDHPDKELRLTPEEGLPYEIKLGGTEVTLMELVIDEFGNVLPEATAFYPDVVYRCLATCKEK